MKSCVHYMLVGLPLTLGLAGCFEPFVSLPLNDLTISELYSAGLTSVGTGYDTCGGTDGPAVMRVALRTSERAPVTPATTFDGQRIDFRDDSISFGSSALFEMPNIGCNASCSEGFTCAKPPGIDDSTYERCIHSDESELSVRGDPRFVSKLDKTQLYGVMLELTSSWRGELPESITNLNPDFDGDGRGDPGASIALQGFNTERATDRQDRRLNLILGMVTSAWNDVRSNALNTYGTETYFGFWTFGSSGASTSSRITALDSVPEDTEFVSSDGRAIAAVNSVGGYDGEAAQAAVYESMVTVLESTTGYASSNFAGDEKILTVIVDGPDGLRLSSYDAERVINAAQAIDARIFIIHIDTPVQTTDTDTSTGDEIPLFPDDPSYFLDQDGFTSEADCDCHDFEVCRTVTQYSTTPGSATDVPSPADASKLFCVPEYGEDGRIGPIGDYARIACATGGGYIYVPDLGDLQAQAAWLPYALDGLWEVPVEVETISREVVEPGQPYLLQTQLKVELDGEVYDYTHLPNPGANTPGDRRMVVFSK